MSRARFTFSLAAIAAASLFSSGLPKGALAQTPPAAPPAAAAAPQGAMGGVNFDIDQLAKSPLGSWAEYTMSKTGSDKSVKVRYALVEKTAQRLGLEINTPTPQGDVTMRFDFESRPDAWKLVGGKMQRGQDKMDMPRDQLDATPPVKKGASPGDLVGTESVTIAAGTFPCKHYRSKVSPDADSPVMDTWISDKVAPTGLVKSALSPLGIGMQLSATGVGAQAKTN